LGGLLKGWLAGSFPVARPPEQQRVRDLLHEIEAAQNAVVNTAKALGNLQ